RRAGLTPSLGRDPEEVRRFLREWYAPYVRERWGLAYAGLDATTVRHLPRYAELLWIHRRGGDRIAGVLLEPQGPALRMLVLGMLDGDARRDGALAAVYCFALAEAVRRGRAVLRTGGARPVLSDGVLEFKRKWGAGLRAARQQDYVAVTLGSWSPAVRAL